jgi:hypothetical protein
VREIQKARQFADDLFLARQNAKHFAFAGYFRGLFVPRAFDLKVRQFAGDLSSCRAGRSIGRESFAKASVTPIISHQDSSRIFEISN